MQRSCSYDFSGLEFFAYLDIDNVLFLSELGLDVSHTDTCLRIRQHDTGGYITDDFALFIANLVSVTRDRTLQTFEMNKFTFYQPRKGRGAVKVRKVESYEEFSV